MCEWKIINSVRGKPNHCAENGQGFEGSLRWNKEDNHDYREKVGVIENRLDAVEGRLDSVDTELISLKVGQKEMGTDIRVIKDRLEVKEEIYALKERLSAVETEIGKGKIKA